MQDKKDQVFMWDFL